MLVNLTPHPVVFADGRILPKCDNPPRLAETAAAVGVVDGIPVVVKTFDLDGCDMPEHDYSYHCDRCGFSRADVEGYCPSCDGPRYYIVSLLIAQAFSGRRDDLLIPNDPIRDDEGRITGCRSLARV